MKVKIYCRGTGDPVSDCECYRCRLPDQPEVNAPDMVKWFKQERFATVPKAFRMTKPL